MPQESIPNSTDLANAIKQRRLELGLTIEEAARKAEVGVKTWCRYEAGEPIRRDKCAMICRALKWLRLPIAEEPATKLTLDEAKRHSAWSSDLEQKFGPLAALSFAGGSDVLMDQLDDALDELSHLPKGTHVGELDASMLADVLPPQFLTAYDYTFLYAMRCTLKNLRLRAGTGQEFVAHSVAEELLIYLAVDDAELLMDDRVRREQGDAWKEWVFDLFDDCDLLANLYDDVFLTADNAYHFEHWFEPQFFCA